MSARGELKRHNAYKAGAAYAIAAWLMIQLAVILSPALPMQKWTIPFIISVSILVSPFTLAIQVFAEMSGAERLNKLKTTYNIIKAEIIF
jgi:hypothetical protein